MGDAPAAPEAIPDYGFLEGGPDCLLSARDRIVIRAGADLIVENLLDLSHASFLHDGILGSAATVAAQTEVEQHARGLTVRRWMPGVPSPRLFDTFSEQPGRRVDMWFDMNWQAPCALVNDVGATDPGSDRSLGYRILGAHILTPETATTTHYHFAAALRVPPGHDAAQDARIGRFPRSAATPSSSRMRPSSRPSSGNCCGRAPTRHAPPCSRSTSVPSAIAG